MTRSIRLRAASLVLLMLSLAIAAPAWSDIVFSNLEARLEVVANGAGGQTISLLAGGPLGLGGIAAGRVTQTETSDTIWIAGTEEVSGVEPTPFFPVGEGDVSGIDPTPFAPDEARVLTFEFDETGQLSGVQPTPFRIYVATPGGYIGQLSFENATASPGSIILSGVALDTGASLVPVEDFVITGLPTSVPGRSLQSAALLGALLLASALFVISARRSTGAIHAGSIE